MNAFQSWHTVLIQKYSTFSGRAGRPEYWWFALLQGVVYLTFYLLAQASVAMSIVWLLLLAATIIPSLAVSVRRLHDTNRSGWWQLLAIVPFGSIVLLVFVASRGDAAFNQYGPPPGQLVHGATPAAAQWGRDPYGRYAQRYFDGTTWTQHVSDGNGQTLVDSPTFQPPRFN